MIRYQITDGTAHLDEEAWFASLNPGADYIQIRENRLSIGDLARLVTRVSSCTKVFVNDRTDVALACGAAGVHLRAGSVAPAVIRKIAPAGFLISVACHNQEDVRRAEGADYALLSPVFRPLSKTDTREPLGLALLARIAKTSPVFVIALGGITEANAEECVSAGAAGVAGISLFRRG